MSSKVAVGVAYGLFSRPEHLGYTLKPLFRGGEVDIVPFKGPTLGVSQLLSQS